MKKRISLLLVFCLMLSLFSATAMAADNEYIDYKISEVNDGSVTIDLVAKKAVIFRSLQGKVTVDDETVTFDSFAASDAAATSNSNKDNKSFLFYNGSVKADVDAVIGTITLKVTGEVAEAGIPVSVSVTRFQVMDEAGGEATTVTTEQTSSDLVIKAGETPAATAVAADKAITLNGGAAVPAGTTISVTVSGDTIVADKKDAELIAVTGLPEGVTYTAAAADGVITVTLGGTVTSKDAVEAKAVTMSIPAGALTTTTTALDVTGEVTVAVVAAEAQAHSVTIGSLTNGAVTANPTSAKANETVTLTVKPDAGYTLKAGSVKVTAGNAVVAVTEGEDGTYTFTMPDDDAIVTAEFEAATYKVTAAASEDGTVALSAETAKMGDSITVTLTPNDGKTAKAVVYQYTDPATGKMAYKDATGKGEGAFEFTMPGADVTVVAKFETVQFTVFFKAEKDSTEAISEKKVDAGTTELTMPSAPTKEGNIFDGWTIDGTTKFAAGAKATVEAVSADVTVYALWTEKTAEEQQKIDEAATAVAEEGVEAAKPLTGETQAEEVSAEAVKGTLEGKSDAETAEAINDAAASVTPSDNVTSNAKTQTKDEETEKAETVAAVNALVDAGLAKLDDEGNIVVDEGKEIVKVDEFALNITSPSFEATDTQKKVSLNIELYKTTKAVVGEVDTNGNLKDEVSDENSIAIPGSEERIREFSEPQTISMTIAGLTDDPTKVDVIHYDEDDDGKAIPSSAESLTSEYNPTTGQLSFETTKLSPFDIIAAVNAIVEKDDSSKNYGNLQAAVNAVNGSATITIPKDAEEVTDPVVVAAGKTITVNNESGFDVGFMTASGDIVTAEAGKEEPTVIESKTPVGPIPSYPTGGGSGSSGGGGSVSYAVNVKDAENGTVEVSHKRASSGVTVTITPKADEGYTVGAVTVTDVKGNEIAVTEKDGAYTFRMPSAAVNVEVTFAAKTSFTDVEKDAWYEEAVNWAVNHDPQVTNGMTTTTFEPDTICTRGQMVTFLYRAAGEPEVKTTDNPFTDVAETDYFYNAVLWAVESGVTKGTTDTTFAPADKVTRAQAMTFIARHAGVSDTADVTELKLTSDATVKFTDLEDGAYYVNAVLWAADKGIARGMTDTTFEPGTECSRAMIVTFLYRYFNA